MKYFLLALIATMLCSASYGETNITEKATDTFDSVATQVTDTMTKLTPSKRSALEKRLQDENLISTNPFGIALYKPTYVLPFYYTQTPYNEVYQGTTPDDQKIQSEEFKAQLSLKLALLHDLILGKHSSLNIAYTQLMYWQFYTQSQFFRETDYEPELFITKRIIPNWWVSAGIVHQSNGRGGELERSWNRAYINLQFSSTHWMVSLKPWLLIFKNESSNLHNPDISHYLGHGETVMAFKFANNTFSLMLRNNLDSGFKRGAEEFSYSFPIYKALKGYLQFFSGYGQSLIEYDHYTNSAGIGISLSDWI